MIGMREQPLHSSLPACNQLGDRARSDCLLSSEMDQIARFVYHDLYEEAEAAGVSIEIRSLYATLEANVPNIFEGTTDFGWTASLSITPATGKAYGFGFGAPFQLAIPAPELSIKAQKSGPSYIAISSVMSGQMNSALLYKGAPVGSTVVSLEIPVKGLRSDAGRWAPPR